MSAVLASRGMGGNLLASFGMGVKSGSGPTPPTTQDKFTISGPDIIDLFPFVGISSPSDWNVRRQTVP